MLNVMSYFIYFEQKPLLDILAVQINIQKPFIFQLYIQNMTVFTFHIVAHYSLLARHTESINDEQ